MINSNINSVEKFWKWFANNSNDLQPNNISIRMQKKLDKKVKSLGVPSWEIGPYNTDLKLSFFALSPLFKKAEFEANKGIINQAPELTGWVFLAAKPAKNWSRIFEWQGHRIDASEWKLVVYGYEDGLYDFVFIGNELGELPKTCHTEIMALLISSEIGEIGLMNKTNAIEYESNPSIEMLKSAIQLIDLKSVIYA